MELLTTITDDSGFIGIANFDHYQLPWSKW